MPKGCNILLTLMMFIRMSSPKFETNSMKKIEIAALFGFFIVTDDDRPRYLTSILPIIAVIITVFRSRKL